MTGELSVLTPSQLGQYIKGMMDRDDVLSGVLILVLMCSIGLY